MKNKPVSGVYAIINISERRSYVGSSVDVRTRLVSHRERLKRDKHHARNLQADWKRLGEKAFSFLFLEEADLTALQDRENFWMTALRGRDRYNSCGAGRRRDMRYRRLTQTETEAGHITVGQPVWFRQRVWEVEEIYQHMGSKHAVLAVPNHRETIRGLHYGVPFTPMECE